MAPRLGKAPWACDPWKVPQAVFPRGHVSRGKINTCPGSPFGVCHCHAPPPRSRECLSAPCQKSELPPLPVSSFIRLVGSLSPMASTLASCLHHDPAPGRGHPITGSRTTCHHSCSTPEIKLLLKKKFRDFPGSPVVKNPPCNAGDMGSIPSQGTEIPHTTSGRSGAWRAAWGQGGRLGRAKGRG